MPGLAWSSKSGVVNRIAIELQEEIGYSASLTWWVI